jgi:S-layer homology domain
MVRTVRRLTLALAVGLIAGAGFWGANALASHQFGDVSDASPSHDDVGWMAQHGIATGFPNGDFRPTESVNRQQASRWFRNYNSSLQVVFNQVDPAQNSVFVASADCGPNSRPLSGGGWIDIGNAFLTRSFRAGSSWFVNYETDNNALLNPAAIQVTALCAPDFSTGE